MLKFYAVQPGFYQTIRQYPILLQNLSDISKPQQNQILVSISQTDLTQSALSYFQSAIYEKGCELLFDMQIRQGKCTVKEQYVELDDENNPFVDLLCRKYPFHFVCDLE